MKKESEQIPSGPTLSVFFGLGTGSLKTEKNTVQEDRTVRPNGNTDSTKEINTLKFKRGTKFGSLRSYQYRDLRINTLCDILVKLKMAYFSRCIRDIKLGMNKILFCCKSHLAEEQQNWGTPAVRRGEAHMRYGLENAACSSYELVQE